MKEKTPGIGPSASAIGFIGFGIYGIGETHGYLNTIIFIIIAILGIYLTSQYLGSRKIRDAEIVYNPNEFFLVAFLCFISIVGIYSCYSIYNNENILGETVAADAIVLVVLFSICLPGYFIYTQIKNRKDKIILRETEIEIADNGNTIIIQHEDVLNYSLIKQKLTFSLKNVTNKTIDLAELNLNSRDAEKLNSDLQKNLIKKD